MVKFLLERPIAVVMSFFALFIMGGIAAMQLPVSLMPDIDIPEITVQVSRDEASAAELEKTIIAPLRQQLMQTPNLDNITSETKDGAATIRLKFEYGTKIDYAFIEVNEKVDASMRYLPRDIDRPNIIKASASDLPVFYLNARLKDVNVNEDRFMEFCEFSEAYIKKQLEQLPEVATVDMSGLLYPELYIQPDESKLKGMGLTQEFIQNTLKENNITVGSLLVRDGYYEYSIRFSAGLYKPEDIEDVYFKVNGKVLQLKDIAQVGISPRNARGMFFNKEHQAINMAIIKQSGARMSELKKNVSAVIDRLEKEHPDISFEVVRDQTYILDYSINNLIQSLIVGILLCCLSMFFFLKDVKSPILISISVPVSLIITMLLFKGFNLSINIISLAGLILAVGNMVDNSIVVIDNITQEREDGLSLFNACIKGTNEVITPMLSSLLTSCAVFIPLVFLSGISGALFYDQAMAVTIGLGVSLIVSITLIPVLYHLINKSERDGKISTWLKQTHTLNLEGFYDTSFNFFFRHRKISIIGFTIFLMLGVFVYQLLKVERMPFLEPNEVIAKINWNQNIHIDENSRRTREMYFHVKAELKEANSWVGEQQFLIVNDDQQNVTDASLYLKVSNNKSLEQLKLKLMTFIQNRYPNAVLSFKPVKTVFEQLFEDDSPPLVAHISLSSEKGIPEINELTKITDNLSKHFPSQAFTAIPVKEHMLIQLKPEAMALYEINYNQLIAEIKKALNKNTIDVLRSRNRYLPIVISGKEKSIYELIHSGQIRNAKNENIPLTALIEISKEVDYKSLYGSKEGAFVPLIFNNLSDLDNGKVLDSISSITGESKDINISFSGSLFEGEKLMKEMSFVLIISLILLYFILAAQFESLTQPIIVLLEIPIGIAAALLCLYVTGNSLNLMSMIGLVVMMGLIINDSILKIDTVNRLRKQGLSVLEAIHEGGRKRLKPILMTALTSVLAVIPLFFYMDLGSQLQKPFAVTLTGGMIIGTFVSLYFIPICYYYLMRNKSQLSKKQDK